MKKGTTGCRVVCRRLPRKFTSQDLWRIYCSHLSLIEQLKFFVTIRQNNGNCFDVGNKEDKDKRDGRTTEDLTRAARLLRELAELMLKEAGFLKELTAFMAGYALGDADFGTGVLIADEEVREILRSRARGRNRLPIPIVDAITRDVGEVYSQITAKGRNLSKLRYVPQTQIGKGIYGPSAAVAESLLSFSSSIEESSERLDKSAQAAARSIDTVILFIEQLSEF